VELATLEGYLGRLRGEDDVGDDLIDLRPSLVVIVKGLQPEELPFDVLGELEWA